MKIHTTNYQNTFIAVAEDCPALTGEIPKPRNGKETVAGVQYRLLQDNPYKFTSDELLFKVHALRKGYSGPDLHDARKEFFSKGQACMRASALSKKFGWGVHKDPEGRIALVARDSEEYERMLKDDTLKKVKAMRSRRE